MIRAAIAPLPFATPHPAEANPLAQAGIMLDAARAAFDAAIETGAGEDDLGIAEAAFLAADRAYRDELTRATGQDADVISRRLM